MRRDSGHILDELLVLRAQEGDRRAFEALFRRWAPRIAARSMRLLADRDAAHDAAQDTWLAIARGIRSLDDPASFGAWVHRIVSRRCADHIRLKQRDRAATPDPEQQHGGTDDDEIERLREAIRSLPNEQQTLLRLHYLANVPVREIASMLGVPGGTVKSRLYHARQELRDSLERSRQ